MMQGTMPGARRGGRPHQYVDMTPLGRVNYSIRMTKNRWRKYFDGVANPRMEDG